ncbi:MAG TPA: radical SAM protein [Candidatus Polarisedimenticolia bacterium]|nr:radical SAM protein [Candidatus Polarisedimenticolia bacterium]
MRVLIVRPIAPNERFGLGPFFRIEPLGSEYVAAGLQAAGHEADVYDLRFSPRLERLLERHRPHVVGIAGAHTLDTGEVLAVARRVKAFDPAIVTLAGGHAVAVYPEPFEDPAVDAVCLEDGERAAPALVAALQTGEPLQGVPGILARADRRDPSCRSFLAGPSSAERVGLDEVPLPARSRLRSSHRHYLCVQRKPVYLVETARGCPYRCRFCTVWQHVARSYRCRSIDWVCRDLQSVGGNVFVADDLFWYPPERSLELAVELRRRGIRKDWLLVQTRTDLVARHPDLLEAWRPAARHFDIFFGFEAPTDRGLQGLSKDSGTDDTRRAVDLCRRLGYGITGNFIVDPDWGVEDFENLWDFTDSMQLNHVGFTILTPLPGTAFFEEMKARILEPDWSCYDMHHILWEPRLGRERFFALFAETWRRTALHVRDRRGIWSYLRQVRPAQIPFMLSVLRRSRRLFDPAADLTETFPPGAGAVFPPAGTADAAPAGRIDRGDVSSSGENPIRATAARVQ